MAVLGITKVTARIPVGNRVMQTFRTSALGTGSATEWIATGFSSIDAIVGQAVLGTSGDVITPNFVINAQGTGVAAGVNPGDLGLEVSEAGTNAVLVTVIGIP